MFEEIYTHFDAGRHGEILNLRMTAQQIRHPEPASVFKTEVLEAVDKDRPRALIIDFTHVTYLGSSMFAALLSLRGELERRGVLYAVCGLHPDVELASNIVGLPRLVATYDDTHAAREAIQKALEPR